ncbi:MAG TPA: hypothetical protein VH120_14495 [Gemmataceae bacterium]|nr:hypothetical protein [Gemmataceae bacterium]
MWITVRAVTIGIVFTIIGAALAADNDAPSLIDRALQAAGGADQLAKPRAYSFKQEMTTHTKKLPAGLTTHSTFYFQPPKKMRMEEEGELNGQPVKYVEVINGNRGWGKRNGSPVALSPQAISHPLEVQQGFGYKFILLLKDKAYKPSLISQPPAGDANLLGLKLVRPVGRGSEEWRLYFDPTTYLLAKSERHSRLSTGGELSAEQTWGDYKTIDGIAVPHKVTHTVKDTAGTTIERLYSDFRFVDELDSHLFERP